MLSEVLSLVHCRSAPRVGDACRFPPCGRLPCQGRPPLNTRTARSMHGMLMSVGLFAFYSERFAGTRFSLARHLARMLCHLIIKCGWRDRSAPEMSPTTKSGLLDRPGPARILCTVEISFTARSGIELWARTGREARVLRGKVTRQGSDDAGPATTCLRCRQWPRMGVLKTGQGPAHVLRAHESVARGYRERGILWWRPD